MEMTGMSGSSPREWGLAGPGHPDLDLRGLIPTRVGTGPPRPARSTRPTAHPHASGDWGVRRRHTPRGTGSSPREWGLDPLDDELPVLHGLIPTRVGTGRPGVSAETSPGAHPHASGDWRKMSPPSPTFRGSSPREWGLEEQVLLGLQRPGLIPTRVGARLRVTLDRWKPAGSSPREWGLVCAGRQGGNGRWAQPTRVGTGWPAESGAARARAHPHASGDSGPRRSPGTGPGRLIPTRVGTGRRAPQRVGCCAGSSPREWGLARRPGAPRGRGRLIPTRVGTGCATFDNPDRDSGSSPREWGLERGASGGGPLGGLIPTRVGTGPSRRPRRSR